LKVFNQLEEKGIEQARIPEMMRELKRAAG
jgi:hypothetical protein